MARSNKKGLTPGRFILLVSGVSLLGGLLFAAAAYEAGYLFFAKGLFLGALLAPLHLLGLKSMTGKLLGAGEAKGPGLFRLYYLIRLLLFACIILVFVSVSVWCLLGALFSYTWFLLVLAWAGLKGTVLEKKTTLSGL